LPNLPQRDVGDPRKLHGTSKTFRAIKKDLHRIEEADLIIAILDGPDVDSGTAFEVGYASAKEKPVIGFKTDIRVFALGEEVNNMLAQSVKIVKNFDELLSVIKCFQKSKNFPKKLKLWRDNP